MKMSIGKYIIFEGGEGSGKGTHSKFLIDYLKSKEVPVEYTREPGGVKEAEKIREIILSKNNDLSSLTELYLYEAARTEVFGKIIIPKLKSGITIVSDRSMYSTEAYQGYAGGMDLDLIRQLNHVSTFGINPDLAIFIDVDPECGLKKEISPDRMAAKGLEYHKKVNEGYKKIAKNNPKNSILVPYIEKGLDEMKSKYMPRINKIFNF